MSGLYRCKCRVGYRPYRSNKIIVFHERQVAQASLTLAYNPNPLTMNQESPTPVTEFASALNDSTVNVTLSDPYMTGVSWAALFDSAAAYNSGTQAAAYHILLPACKEGEDPASGKCTDVYQTLDDPNLGQSAFGDFAHIILKLYYEVAGVNFGLDTYFRLRGFNITHGSAYPQVQLQGVNPSTISFNQSLATFKFNEGETLEETLKKISNEYNHEISFCNNLEARSKTPYVMPRSFREKSVTAEEVIRKYLASVNGSYLSLPTKEYANKVSVCARANINQGCSVFYLGKGLYERYGISGNVDENVVNRNTEYTSYNSNLSSQFDSAPFEEQTYTVEDVLPNKRKAKLKDAKTDIVAPTDQFAVYTNRYASGGGANSGLVWRSSGPEISTEKLDRVNLYGIAVNGEKSLALLDGQVISAKDGRVLIVSNYFIRYCDKKKTCYNKPIYQESINLNSINEGIKTGTQVRLNQELGKTTAEKPEFFRFFIGDANSNDVVTVQPQIVWKYAAPYNDLTDEERATLNLKRSGEGTAAPPPPSAGNSPAPSSSEAGEVFVARMGNTGSSTGPHVHIQWEDTSRQISEQQARKYVKVDGVLTSGWGPRSCAGCSSFHRGVDIAANEGTPIYLTNGAALASVGNTNCQNGDRGCGGRLGNSVTISTPEGNMVLGHLAPRSVAPGANGRVSGPGSGYSAGVQSGPVSIGAEITTEFVGVPRALRIVPGRTILSFITNYDEWIEKGRPSSIDPRVWIPQRFSNWFIKNAQYNWSGGNLRVNLTAVTDWGNLMSRIKTPSFENYMESFGGELKYKDYYGYIRSLGDLCWKMPDGKKTSCEVICDEAQRVIQGTSGTSGDSASAGRVFPPSQCKYTGQQFANRKETMEQVMGALRTAGITNPYAYAGVLGNFYQESGIQANRHKLADPGVGCERKSPGYGIAQWCGSRQNNIRSKCGDSSTLGCEMEFMVNEIRAEVDVKPGIVAAMNNARSAREAAYIWDEYFERSNPVTGRKVERGDSAEQIFRGFSCSRINP